MVKFAKKTVAFLTRTGALPEDFQFLFTFNWSELTPVAIVTKFLQN